MYKLKNHKLGNQWEEKMTNGYRRNPYYYGQQARGSHDPYSKYPNWAGGLRELLNNMKMMKMWREGQECRRTGKET